MREIQNHTDSPSRVAWPAITGSSRGGAASSEHTMFTPTVFEKRLSAVWLVTEGLLCGELDMRVLY